MTGARANIEIAAEHLRAGGLVAFPTETVYGLGGDATNDRAIARIFEIKGRPEFNPLIVHVSDRDKVRQFAMITDAADRLMRAFWPGPLTLVLTRLGVDQKLPVSRLVSAGLESVAVRQPGHDLAARLLEAAGVPIAAPSANPSGKLSPTRAGDIRLPPPPEGPMVLDGGACEVGIESTVVDCTGAGLHILRPGSVTAAQINARAGLEIIDGAATDPSAPKSPGRLAHHYAPATPLRIDATEIGAGEALLAFGANPLLGAGRTLNLSASGDLVEAASNLFAMLHTLDREGHKRIAVAPIPETGLGVAINDRLKRAAY